MSRLENEHAKPAMKDLILNDNLAFLTSDRIKSITSFAFKSAVIADHMSVPTREPFFSVSARHAFADSLQIPRGVRIWLAAFKEGGHGVFRAIYHPGPANAVRGFELYVFTFGAGFLLFQVVASRWVGPEPSAAMTATQGGVWNKFSIPIWPSSGDTVTWPAKKQLDLRWANEFAHRWKQVSVPGHWLNV